MENNNNKMKLKDIILPPISGEWGNDDEEGNGVLVLRTTNFTNEGIINYENIITRKINKKNINHKYLQKGDILIEKSGGSEKQPVGRVVYFEGEEYKYLFNNFTSVLRIKNKNFINSKYLFLYLYSYYKNGGTLAFQNKTTGLHNLKLEQFVASIEIPVLSISEQQRIANELDKVSELIDKRQTQLKKLDVLIKSKFVEMFGEIRKSIYPIKTLEEICVFIKDGTHQTPIYTEDKGNGYKFLSSKDVTSGKICWEKIKYIPKELHEELYSRIKPQKGDILLAKNGTTGIPAIVENDEVFDIYVSLALLRLRSSFNVVYVWASLLSQDTQEQFNSSLKGIGVPNLHLGEIKKTKVIIPPIELQNQFADFVDKVEQNKIKIKASLDKLNTLKKALMQKYFG